MYVTFLDNLSVPSSKVKILSLTLDDGTVHYVNIPEELRYHLDRSGSLKSRIASRDVCSHLQLPSRLPFVPHRCPFLRDSHFNQHALRERKKFWEDSYTYIETDLYQDSYTYIKTATLISRQLHLYQDSYTYIETATLISRQLHVYQDSYTYIKAATLISIPLHLYQFRYTYIKTATLISIPLHLYQDSYTYIKTATLISRQLHLYQDRYTCIKTATLISRQLHLYQDSYTYIKTATLIPRQLHLYQDSYTYMKTATLIPRLLHLYQDSKRHRIKMCRHISGAAILKKLRTDWADGGKVVTRKSSTKLQYAPYGRAKPGSTTNRTVGSLTIFLELRCCTVGRAEGLFGRWPWTAVAVLYFEVKE